MSGPQCCSNPPTLSSSSGGGHVEELGGLKNYVSGSLDSKRAILLVSDVCGFDEGKQTLPMPVYSFLWITKPENEVSGEYLAFGYEAPKFRKFADKVAACGFYVVVPDFFFGEPLNLEHPVKPIHVWLKDHGADKGFEDAKLVLEAIKSKGISRIGAAGFCWGAKVVVELAKHDYIQAAVLLHPAFVTFEDIQAVKVPISILGAEIDIMSPPELLNKFDSALNEKPEVDGFVKIFPGVAHGWTLRYEDGDEHAVKCAEEACNDVLDWFGKYLK